MCEHFSRIKVHGPFRLLIGVLDSAHRAFSEIVGAIFVKIGFKEPISFNWCKHKRCMSEETIDKVVQLNFVPCWFVYHENFPMRKWSRSAFPPTETSSDSASESRFCPTSHRRLCLVRRSTNRFSRRSPYCPRCPSIPGLFWCAIPEIDLFSNNAEKCSLSNLQHFNALNGHEQRHGDEAGQHNRALQKAVEITVWKACDIFANFILGPASYRNSI